MRIAVNSKMQESLQWLELTLAYFVAFFTFVLISCNTKKYSDSYFYNINVSPKKHFIFRITPFPDCLK